MSRSLQLQPALLILALAAITAGGQATEPRMPINLWVSGGLGPSGFHQSSGVTLRGSGSLSVDRGVLKVRRSVTFEGVDGHQDLEERAVLAGWRLGDNYAYMIPAIGVGTARFDDDMCEAHVTCTPAVAASRDSEGAVVAYDIGLHMSRLVLGLAFNVSGTIGPSKRSHTALTLSLEFGAFRP